MPLTNPATGVTSYVTPLIAFMNGIPNASLVNSSFTIGSTVATLGATVATIAGLTLTSPTFTGTAAAAAINASGTISATGGITSGGNVVASGSVTGTSFTGAGTGLTGTAASLTAGTANALNQGNNYTINNELIFHNGGTGTGYISSNNPNAGLVYIPSIDGSIYSHAFYNAASSIALLGITPTGNLVAAGSVTGTSLLSNSPTTGSGYTTGAGGTVTQSTSRTTAVTINKPTGAITMFSAAGSASVASFTVNNSTVGTNDTVLAVVRGGTSNTYSVTASGISAGSFNIVFYSLSGTATDTPVINFTVQKGSAS